MTGSTDGVGRCVAETLGRAGYTILIHGRDRHRADAVVAGIKAAGGQATAYLADFSSLADVRLLASGILESHPVIDAVINNAGVGFGQPGETRAESKDGHELRFAVNYLAPFLLTYLLLPGLANGRGRVVNVASVGQAPIDFDDVMLNHDWSGERADRQSKLALIMATFDLALALRPFGVTVNALHPATFIPTAMVLESGVALLSTVREGADAIVQLVTAPQWHGRSGLYFDGTRPAQAHAQAYDPEARSRLRVLSFELVRLGHPDEQRGPGVERPGHSHTAAFPSSEDISI
ncbi:FIG00794380: hypothetical protein [plant metagenome]|uniref:Uncharacterized protein n=1 Tax=plant metagenome TaxID=1297885 RepID=A0A484P5T9_9ZZZZ